MHAQRYKNIATYVLVAFNVAVVYFVILIFNKLSGFTGSTAFISEYTTLNAVTSIVFLTGIGYVLQRKRLVVGSYGSAILLGLTISCCVWLGVIAVALFHGFYSSPFFEQQIFYWPLYPIGYFQEWVSELFLINMGTPLTPASIAASVVFTLMYQLCYAMIPVGIILCLKKFKK